MQKIMALAAAALLACNSGNAQTMIGRNNISLKSDCMTPEALWAMGRISNIAPSPDGKHVAYQVGYYSVKENKGHQILYTKGIDGRQGHQLTTDSENETDPAWIDKGQRIAFLRNGQLWTMRADGTERRQLTHSTTEIEGFKFSPDESKVILIKSIDYHGSIQKNPADLPLASGMVITDMNYRHWDHYVKRITHPFVATVSAEGIGDGTDILAAQPYECPMAPFGGIEQLAWSIDSKSIAYTCRRKEGVDYAISTDADIFLYDVASNTSHNLCKPANYQEPAIDATKSMKEQAVNRQSPDMNVGYDVNPCFSPDGKYLAWQSMAHNGYESDLNRLCVYDLSTGQKKYVTNTKNFDSNVDGFTWAADSKSLYFNGVWHATSMLWNVTLDGTVRQLTDGWYDYGTPQLINNQQLVATRHSISHPDDIYLITPSKKEKQAKVEPITNENKHILDQLEMGKVMERWVKTSDGQQEQVWIILPPHFDPTKKYPTLLYCEGGPQSPVSQFWSYRWNFQIMAAHGYVVVAPNRHGLPGYGSKWNEQISGDWTGQCMSDYLAAIDDATSNLNFVDKDRLGCVGASFGGFSVYYLAGHHNKRFKAFIAHDGAFNLESMYTDTEEAWFSNWEYEDAYWNKDLSANAKRTYSNSPHRFIDQWDTPILCIHGEKDYRINANQGMGAFNAARLKGIPAELLLFPDENHWVLKPQNGILWQRTFFSWLDRWLKK